MSMNESANGWDEWNEVQVREIATPAGNSQFPAPTAAPDGRRLPRFAPRSMQLSPYLGAASGAAAIR